MMEETGRDQGRRGISGWNGREGIGIREETGGDYRRRGNIFTGLRTR
jgi:hypothetical protein